MLTTPCFRYIFRRCRRARAMRGAICCCRREGLQAPIATRMPPYHYYAPLRALFRATPSLRRYFATCCCLTIFFFRHKRGCYASAYADVYYDAALSRLIIFDFTLRYVYTEFAIFRCIFMRHNNIYYRLSIDVTQACCAFERAAILPLAYRYCLILRRCSR